MPAEKKHNHPIYSHFNVNEILTFPNQVSLRIKCKHCKQFIIDHVTHLRRHLAKYIISN